ncbi:hypothetical protein [Salipiger thiooxidans]|uniref:hypothetical protein n=1 Tax=Salipiger thiooxidans TaxID=282683 RepID=UPI001CFC2C2A|nr:hypothetical protein [Salipiger thiooxidans]
MSFQEKFAGLEIDHVFESVSYTPSPESRRRVALGVKRDLQAKTLRPNVKVPSRPDLPVYLRTMYRETGSVTQVNRTGFAGGFNS